MKSHEITTSVPVSGKQPDLIWCNYNGRDRIANFIERAEDRLFIQNERYQFGS